MRMGYSIQIWVYGYKLEHIRSVIQKTAKLDISSLRRWSIEKTHNAVFGFINSNLKQKDAQSACAKSTNKGVS